MRYVPNLIPEKSKILNEYFKGSIHSKKSSNHTWSFLGWFVGFTLLLFALVSITHPLLTLLFGSIGFMLLPTGHNWIEKKFKFHLTTKIKSILASSLFLFTLPLLAYYDVIDKQEAHQLKLKTEQENKLKEETQHKEKIRNDSLIFYVDASSKFANNHKTNDALKQLEKANSFAKLSTDRKKISIEKDKILTIKSLDLIASKKYKTALPILNDLISRGGNNSTLFYNRAICYSKTGKIKDAVDDCKIATQLGDENATKLFNKINPIKKRIAYYVTRCCDGSTSSATGRGACSHHGGVCDWNDPVYEEYRKYE